MDIGEISKGSIKEPGHLVVVSTAEDPNVVAAVRVTDQHERCHLTGEVEGASEVVHGVREGVPSARIARAEIEEELRALESRCALPLSTLGMSRLNCPAR